MIRLCYGGMSAVSFHMNTGLIETVKREAKAEAYKEAANILANAISG